MGKSQITEEIWRAIPGFEPFAASNLGRVRSINGILRGSINKDGYVKITIKDVHNKIHTKTRSSLIALSWLGDRPEGHFVCHNNGTRNDDRPENLSYKTPLGNSNDRYDHNTMLFGERNPNYKYSDEVIAEIYTSSKGSKELSEQFGVTASYIWGIQSGRFRADVTSKLQRVSLASKTSKYRGVGKKNNRWMVNLTKNGKLYRYYGFLTEVDAAIFFNKKSEELFGPGGYQNII